MWLRSRRCSLPIVPLPINRYPMVSLTPMTLLTPAGRDSERPSVFASRDWSMLSQELREPSRTVMPPESGRGAESNQWSSEGSKVRSHEQRCGSLPGAGRRSGAPPCSPIAGVLRASGSAHTTSPVAGAERMTDCSAPNCSNASRSSNDVQRDAAFLAVELPRIRAHRRPMQVPWIRSHPCRSTNHSEWLP